MTLKLSLKKTIYDFQRIFGKVKNYYYNKTPGPMLSKYYSKKYKAWIIKCQNGSFNVKTGRYYPKKRYYSA